MLRLQQLRLSLEQAQDKLNRNAAKRDLLEQQRDEAIVKRAEAMKELGMNDLVQILLEMTSRYAREQVKSQLEETVTAALQMVFQEPILFKIDIQVRSNQPEADYYIEKNGILMQLKKPDYSQGGGYVDVIVLALRMALAELTTMTGPLLLDEVGKHVSAEYAPNVAYLLKEYSVQFNRQIVLITHNKHLAEIGDTSYLVELDAKGYSKATLVKGGEL